ncbi:Amuc_1098 family type IV pilus outer membrane protein [Roseibacillus ishigakijimensis]|uniref:Type II and III secretion system protein n=1 Tax=Roseibacillus ishigakijimensis TaxID=454146 RepID=A0A934RN33_9BACT|nr:Amuc_1098 family type IV pilus outer membrane protein [Roseibacillus ishigakijimensis]MBK1834832.1 type II and III secretion system protein [Roseibacillus ishigakijimensis]
MQHTTTRIHAGLLALAFAATPISYSSGQSLLEKERLRREAATQQAVDLLMEGRQSYASKDFEEAVRLYKEALNVLPYGPKTEAKRNEIVAHLGDGSVALAQQYRRTGKYDEAKGLLNDVLVADPHRFEAQKSLEYFDDPIRVNPSLTHEHSQNVDEVRRLLYKGEGFYNLADYDNAEKQFHSVLRIDPYNKAARRWLERVAAIKSDYYRAAYDHTRSKLLMEVDKAWELTVPSISAAGDFGPAGGQQGGGRSLNLTNKLQNIIIPRVDFADTPLDEAMEYLTQKSIELDPDPNPDRKGINFVIEKGSISGGASGPDEDLDGGGLLLGADPGSKSIDTLRLRNVPLATALEYVCNKTGMRYRVDEYAVTLLPIGADSSADLVTRTWTVPPTFVTDLSDNDGGGGGGASDDPFASNDGGLGGGGLSVRRTVKELLADSGVEFPDGASARFISSSSSLIVKNTVGNLDLVDQIVENLLKNTPKQIHIMTKFVEVSQENTDELGFDWLITPFRVSSEFFPGGGTTSNGAARSGGDFLGTVGAFNLPNVPADSSAALTGGTITSGLRSGDYAISKNSIDSVLNNPNRTAQNNSVAPGILSLTGLFTDGQVQMIMRGLAQKKGTDIMTAPSVLARSGETATIEIIREFIYPTEYEPPELPNQVGATGGIGGAGSGAGIFPVTPSTPTAFETRNTGVTLEIQPTIGANDYVIDLRFAPEIVEFEGFINYGSPITSPASDAFGNPTNVTITENRIEMPVFASRRVTTGLTIYDGHTVAVGGLMREDVQRVEDKVPIFGDLPWIGRLFQSNSENHIKSNLIIFVTAQIQDASGNPVNGGNTGLGDPGLGVGGSSAPAGLDASLLPPLDTTSGK